MRFHHAFGLVFSFCASLTAHASNYSFLTVDVPSATETRATGINDGGQVAGTFLDGTRVAHGFLRDAGGVFTLFDVPGSLETIANGINGGGVIVGSYLDSSSVRRGFLRASGGAFVLLTAPPGAIVDPAGINALGEVVGALDDSTGTHGFQREPDGSYLVFDVSGALSTRGNGLNVAGTIVGTYSTAGKPVNGFARTAGGVFSPLTTPLGAIVDPAGIDSNGRIVGFFGDNRGVNHGFLIDSNGEFSVIDVPGATQTFIARINDNGNLVGFFEDSQGVHGFIASPVPIPTSFVLFGGGLLALSPRARRSAALA